MSTTYVIPQPLKAIHHDVLSEVSLKYTFCGVGASNFTDDGLATHVVVL